EEEVFDDWGGDGGGASRVGGPTCISPPHSTSPCQEFLATSVFASKTGRVDAVTVSRKLQRMGWIPQLILCSDALRTRETLNIMQEEARGFLEAEVHFISSYYSIAAMDGQTAEHLQRTICQYSRDELFTIMSVSLLPAALISPWLCMGHNRGWEEAASMFTGASVELKTCNAALLEAPGKSWEEVVAAVESTLIETLQFQFAQVSLHYIPHTEGDFATLFSVKTDFLMRYCRSVASDETDYVKQLLERVLTVYK
ncbi:hypothetical protein Gogos_008258, partial [Gossypium gossypioides]|nr:hypothetical protein [Gossypium gossypioides]